MIGFPECTCFCTLSTYFYVHRISVIGSVLSELDLLFVKKYHIFMVLYTNRQTGSCWQKHRLGISYASHFEVIHDSIEVTPIHHGHTILHISYTVEPFLPLLVSRPDYSESVSPSRAETSTEKAYDRVPRSRQSGPD